jgi:hypothetical protein
MIVARDRGMPAPQVLDEDHHRVPIVGFDAFAAKPALIFHHVGDAALAGSPAQRRRVVVIRSEGERPPRFTRIRAAVSKDRLIRVV